MKPRPRGSKSLRSTAQDEVKAESKAHEQEGDVREYRRVFLIVLDSLGVGAMPDAHTFGDQATGGDAGSHTLDHICQAAGPPTAPRLMSLGLGNIEGVESFPAAVVPEGAYGRMAEVSAGKDTTTGHWEMAGVPLEQAFPVFPEGFSDELLGAIAEEAGIDGWLGNEPASGTEIIERLGQESIDSDKPIVYTSADSVMQIAAHEKHFGRKRLRLLCRIARRHTMALGIARIISRPFIDAKAGLPMKFKRTYNRRDFSLLPPKPTVLDALKKAGVPVVGVGKIGDIFAAQGLTRSVHTNGNANGMVRTHECVKDQAAGFIFVNLVDFDMLYGHRRDPEGYKGCIEAFDEALAKLEVDLRDDDLVLITADHGNDPTNQQHTDHTREYVPILAFGKHVKDGHDLGTRTTFADVGATVAHALNVPFGGTGTSFLKEISK
ncbi:MAG: phosphopentomutase [Planctomycetota bacterium]